MEDIMKIETGIFWQETRKYFTQAEINILYKKYVSDEEKDRISANPAIKKAAFREILNIGLIKINGKPARYKCVDPIYSQKENDFIRDSIAKYPNIDEIVLDIDETELKCENDLNIQEFDLFDNIRDCENKEMII